MDVGRNRGRTPVRRLLAGPDGSGQAHGGREGIASGRPAAAFRPGGHRCRGHPARPDGSWGCGRAPRAGHAAPGARAMGMPDCRLLGAIAGRASAGAAASGARGPSPGGAPGGSPSGQGSSDGSQGSPEQTNLPAAERQIMESREHRNRRPVCAPRRGEGWGGDVPAPPPTRSARALVRPGPSGRAHVRATPGGRWPRRSGPGGRPRGAPEEDRAEASRGAANRIIQSRDEVIP